MIYSFIVLANIIKNVFIIFLKNIFEFSTFVKHLYVCYWKNTSFGAILFHFTDTSLYNVKSLIRRVSRNGETAHLFFLRKLEKKIFC